LGCINDAFVLRAARAQQPRAVPNDAKNFHSNQDTESPRFELIFGLRLKEAAKELSICRIIPEFGYIS
jgi:hypothetical protein